MDFSQSGKELAKLELQSGTKAVAIIKDALISITSDDQQESFLDSYLNFRINNGEVERDAKNYRSRVKAVLKNWKEKEKRDLIYSHPSKSVQLLSKYARDLNKKPKTESEESADDSTTAENLLSLGDISAQLDRLAQHLQHHGKFEAVEKLLVISTEILETEEEPATM